VLACCRGLIRDTRIAAAIDEAGDIWISGSFGMRPPQIGGDAIGDRRDVVSHMHGLGDFADEYGNTVELEVDGLRLRVLGGSSSQLTPPSLSASRRASHNLVIGGWCLGSPGSSHSRMRRFEPVRHALSPASCPRGVH